MQEENKTPLSPESEPQNTEEPVDTAVAMKYFEAAEAAAEVGKEILASRKPKKPKKQKKAKKQPEPEASVPPEQPAGEPAEQPEAAAAPPQNGWQPSQPEEAPPEAAEQAEPVSTEEPAESAPTEPETAPDGQPVTEKKWQVSAWALGSGETDRFLCLAPAGLPLGRPGDGGWLECGGVRYEVMAVHGIPLGDGVSHQWAALERRMEDAI